MNITDPIADLLTRIRNGQKASKEVVEVPAGKIKIAIINILKQQGFIRAFKCIRDSKQGIVKIALKYDGNKKGVINSIKRESKCGRRVYVDSRSLPKVKRGFGIAIMSTSQGIMTSQEAEKRSIGGEYMCSVY
ncbi:MAG: 30S ribosomal protein S8 [Zetaproteobacteria bacterium]|nr:30S ribosomal protein S8 [Pseudobdellovibrionaceae bacterium]